MNAAALVSERERERESFIRNNLHNGVVSGAAERERERDLLGNNVHDGVVQGAALLYALTRVCVSSVYF